MNLSSKSTRHLAAFAALLFNFLSSTIARSQILDDFDDNVISPQLWNVTISGFGPEVVAANQRVEMWIPLYSSGSEFSAHVVANFCLQGDYDIQVDFDLPLFPFSNGVRTALGVRGPEVATERTSLAPGDFPGFPAREVYVSDGSGGVQGMTGTSDLYGTLRQVRTGAMVSSYYWDSVNLVWQEISTVLANGVDATPVFQVWSHDGTFQQTDVLVAFDNFRINSGTICGLATSDFFGLNRADSLSVAAPGVLANDYNLDEDPLAAELVSGPIHAASFQLNPDGSFSYIPSPYFVGDDTFTYRCHDGTVFSEIATVHITVSQPGSAGFITGGGKFFQGANKCTFGFVAKVQGSGVQGSVEFQDHDAGLNVKSQSVQWVYSPNPAEGYFSGACSLNGEAGYTYFVQVADQGQPGSSDSFTVWVFDSGGGLVHTAGGVLVGGNIAIHGSS